MNSLETPGSANPFSPAVQSALSAGGLKAGGTSGGKSQMSRDHAMSLARDFEAIFIGTTLKTMFQGVGEEDPLQSGGSAGLQWRDMLMDQYAQTLEKKGGFGLAKPIADSILHLQEHAAPDRTPLRSPYPVTAKP